jgi:serine protease Do
MKLAQLLFAAMAATTFAAAAYAEPDRIGLSLNSSMIVEQASGPAASAGIQPGDKLLAVDGNPIEGVQTLAAFEKVTGTVALLIQRGDETFYVPVLLDDHPLANNP